MKRGHGCRDGVRIAFANKLFLVEHPRPSGCVCIRKLQTRHCRRRGRCCVDGIDRRRIGIRVHSLNLFVRGPVARFDPRHCHRVDPSRFRSGTGAGAGHRTSARTPGEQRQSKDRRKNRFHRFTGFQVVFRPSKSAHPRSSESTPHLARNPISKRPASDHPESADTSLHIVSIRHYVVRKRSIFWTSQRGLR